MEYAIKVRTNDAMDDVEERLREELSEEGFGVLTEIDVKATLAEKLGKDTREHKILGACNPQLADQGLSAEPDLGVLLPCNVTLYADGDATIVSAMKPTTALEMISNPTVEKIAREAERSIYEAITRAVPDADLLNEEAIEGQ